MGERHPAPPPAPAASYSVVTAPLRLFPDREKRCTDCLVTKQLDAFCVNRANPDGRNRRCRLCELAAGRRSRGVLREHSYLVPGSDDRCEICAGDGPLHLDHDHDTGAFRGWLCSNCNTAIGLLSDDPVLLAAALAYLEKAERRVA